MADGAPALRARLAAFACDAAAAALLAGAAHATHDALAAHMQQVRAPRGRAHAAALTRPWARTGSAYQRGGG